MVRAADLLESEDPRARREAARAGSVTRIDINTDDPAAVALWRSLGELARPTTGRMAAERAVSAIVPSPQAPRWVGGVWMIVNRRRALRSHAARLLRECLFCLRQKDMALRV